MSIQKLVVQLYGDRKLFEIESKVLVTNNRKKFICVNQVNMFTEIESSYQKEHKTDNCV